MFDDDTVIAAAANCGASYAQANAATIGAVFGQAFVDAAKAYGLTMGALAAVGTAAAFGVPWAEASIILAGNVCSELLGAVGIIVAGANSIPIVGTIVGAIVALIAGFASLIHTCSVQITNGNTYHCDDYININLRNATDWLKQAKSKDLVGKRPVWMANQFDLFLANPVWMYNNQQLLAISQPPPPDPNDTGGPGPIYYQMPGAFELLNRAQIAIATQVVAATPGQLPFWKNVPYPGLLIPNPDADWQPGGNEPGILTTWQPGKITTQLDPSNPLGGTQTSTYEACPYLTNFPEGVNLTAGMYMLQIMYPALTKSQCDKIFATVQPMYDDVRSQAMSWANTQCPCPYLPDLGPGSSWNLTVEDATAVINAWTGPLDGSCVSAPGPKMAILQALADVQCPAPTATQVQALDKSGTLSDSDAQVIVQRWSYEGRGACVGGRVVEPAASSAATKVAKTAAVAAGVGALGVLAFAHVNHMTFVGAARHLGSKVATGTERLAKKVFPPAHRLKRAR
jgi:hypothetical protein